MPTEVPPIAPPQSIALIGATSVAELIASAALRANLKVIIDDVSDTRLQAVSTNLRDHVGAQHCCAPGPQDQSDSPQSASSFSSAPPNPSLTQSIESAILDSDFLVDTLPDDLAAITFCPDRCLAVHLSAAPNDNAPTFNLIPATNTSPETLAKCSALFLRSLSFCTNEPR